MECYGMAWTGMGWHGVAWNAIECHGMAWNAMEWHGMPWNAMECHGMPWNAMECYGMLWNAMECYGMEWHGMAGNDMEWHGMVWKGMEWHAHDCRRVHAYLRIYKHTAHKHQCTCYTHTLACTPTSITPHNAIRVALHTDKASVVLSHWFMGHFKRQFGNSSPDSLYENEESMKKH